MNDDELESCLLFYVGSSFDLLGKYGEAEQTYRQMVEFREKVLAKEHPSTFASINNLALMLPNQGKYGEAEQTHRQMFDVMAAGYPALCIWMLHDHIINWPIYSSAPAVRIRGTLGISVFLIHTPPVQ